MCRTRYNQLLLTYLILSPPLDKKESQEDQDNQDDEDDQEYKSTIVQEYKSTRG